MKDHKPKAILLEDYKAPNAVINSLDLNFQLFDEHTFVTANIDFSMQEGNQLELHGDGQELVEIQINGENLDTSAYELKDKNLLLKNVSGEFKLKTKVKIYPHKNSELEGLYKSGSIYCTQNEPQGFRRITYFLDRPDVMTVYRTRVEGDKLLYPVLLANGNPVERGDLDGNRHFVTWEDPFKKPSYLFALVAGDLGVIKDEYKTISGRTVALEVYCDKGNESRCYHSMESLKKSMHWDEQRFGLEYDLDIYMIVAVDAFNMGAMENKGLNIFNSVCVLADENSSTDNDFLAIEAVVGHEYFHNWTGNRVTCRDWFQLTLKEGLTVFRDQEFSSDLQSRPVKRIEDVRFFKLKQFAEDAGPMAHPIRPKSYIEINNFYTLTVYEKGSEVIRMIHTLLGEEKFVKGIEKYFELYDGQAVTTDDFIYAMEIASGHDLKQFNDTWYNQSRTPLVSVSLNDNTITFKQTCDLGPGETEKKPFYMPFKVSLYNKKGEEKFNGTVILDSEVKTIDFESEEKLIPSLNQNFSAPVNVNYEYTDSELAVLMSYDKDDYNRFEAGQRYALREIRNMISVETSSPSHPYLEAFSTYLNDENIEPAFKAYALQAPEFETIISDQRPINFEKSHEARKLFLQKIGETHEAKFYDTYRKCQKYLDKDYDLSPESVGLRLLKNTCLSYFVRSNPFKYLELAKKQFDTATNMTDSLAALNSMSLLPNEYFTQASQTFFDRWKDDSLVFLKWLSIESMATRPDALEQIKALTEHERFDINVPNQVRSVIRGLVANYMVFNAKDCSGYAFLTDFIRKYDKINPQIAAGIAGAFNRAHHFDDVRKAKVKDLLQGLIDDRLSDNTFEIISKTLNNMN